MECSEGLRIDLAEVKLHIVKKVGAERSRKYFYYLGRFLNQKVSKSEFDKSCHRLLGKENLPLHNKLVHSILRNASLAKSKSPPPEGSGSLIPNHGGNDHVWSNGVLLPKVVAIRDRPSPLKAAAPVSRDEEAQEERGRSTLSTTTPVVVAPLGVSFCGTRGTVSVSNRGDFISCCDSGGLSEAEMLRKRMESVAVGHGLGGVSPECCSMLSNMLDVYLKRLIKSSCVDLSGARSTNSFQIQTNNQPSDATQEQRLVSLLDFRAGIELSSSQLGEQHWPLLRERVLMRSFEEREGV